MSRRAPHHVAMVAFADAQMLDVVGPLEVFSRASRLATDEGRRGSPPYRVEYPGARRRPGDDVVVARGRRRPRLRQRVRSHRHAHGPRRPRRATARSMIARSSAGCAAPRPRPAASCRCARAPSSSPSGPARRTSKRDHALGGAARACRASYPRVPVETDPIYVRARPHLHVGGRDRRHRSGARAGRGGPRPRSSLREVARGLVLFLRRPGNQAQFSAQLAQQTADREPLREVQRFIADHPGHDLSVAGAGAARAR